ncbi:hypothetical protein [Natronorubrum bangense]|nr:hypothetical protein [Natronorubrum bangense]QCC55828.1 hypothetical protein DV706_05740 [Natronorubrum bangense]
MTPSASESMDETEIRTVKLPTTATTQRALHEAVGHLYDELAIAHEDTGELDHEDTGELDHATELFEQLETLYVATAEESTTDIELTYRLENGHGPQ